MAPKKFYAVRKGRRVGIYNNWNDCKRQVDGYTGNQYKSFSSLKEAQDYIAQDTQALQVVAVKQKDDHVSNQHKRSSSEKKESSCSEQDVQEAQRATKKQRKEEDRLPCDAQGAKMTSKNQRKEEDRLPCDAQGAKMTSKNQDFYFLEFDGASKGNPGKAGAGAVLRNPDGSVACRIREGVGLATNNVAEYRAIIRGLKVCLSKGIECIHVRGDSNLVCMQIQDKWKTKNENIAELSKEAKELKSKFREFQINHVFREFNSEADALANEAIYLPDGKWVLS